MAEKTEEVRAFEDEASCSLMAMPYELHDHAHTKTTNIDGAVVWWECQMTLDDAPIRDVLEASETLLTEQKVTYNPAVRGAALTHAWLCASALGDTYIPFNNALMQVDSGETSQPVSADEPMTEYATFQAFSAQIAQVPLRREGNRTTAAFTASRIFCRGMLDLSIYPDYVDSPDYRGGKYIFTPEQRMVIFGLAPGLELWWRPEIERIRVAREEPYSKCIEEYLGLERHDDPYILAGHLLGRFALNSQNAYGAK